MNSNKNKIVTKTISQYVKELNERNMFVHFSLEKIEDKNYANVGYFFSNIERTLHCETGITQEYLMIEFNPRRFIQANKEIDNWIRCVEDYGIENTESFVDDISRVRTSFFNGVIG